MDVLHTDTDNFLVILDSRNAVSYKNGSYNSSVRFNFENAIKLGINSIKMTCSVFTFTCPNSLYNINETNSLLSLTISGTTTNYNFKLGNYNAKTFMTQLINTIGTNFSITLDTITNAFTLTNSTYDFTINATTTMYSVLGCALNTNYTSSNKVIVVPYTCNFNGIQLLNIHFENLNTANIDSWNESTSTIIQSVPIDCTIQQIAFAKTTDFAFNISQNTIDYIDIGLTDDLENYLNFNNQHWNLTLYFCQTRDFDRFHYTKDFNSILQHGVSLFEE